MRTRLRKALGIAALLTLVAGVTRPAQATETDVIEVGDRVVMRLRAGVDGNSPSDVGDAVRSRLATILERPGVAAARVSVQRGTPGQDAFITVNGELLLRVNRSLAEANGMDEPSELARIWARNLQSALTPVVAQIRASRASAASILWARR